MTDDVITHAVSCTLLDPTSIGRTPSGVVWAPKIPAQLTWHPDNSGSIQVELLPKLALARWLPESITAQARWALDLNMLTAGLDGPAGTADVMVTPAYRRDLVEMILSSGSDQIGLRIRRVPLADFVAACQEWSTHD